MARKQQPPETELAQRLCQVRLAFGFKERGEFADYLGISQTSLGEYEKSVRSPISPALNAYKNIGISLDWIATGEGEMFDSKHRLQTESDINAAHLEQAVHIVEKALTDSKLSAAKKAKLIKLVAAMLRNEQDIEPIKHLIALLR